MTLQTRSVLQGLKRSEEVDFVALEEKARG
jgi:hypothetical protein